MIQRNAISLSLAVALASAADLALTTNAPSAKSDIDRYIATEDFDLGKDRTAPKIEKLPDGKARIGVMILDPVKREIVMPGEIATWERNIEVLIASPRGRSYESLLVAPVRPFHFQVALLALGLNPGKPAEAVGSGKPPSGDPMIVFVDYEDPKTGQKKRVRAEALLFDEQTKKPMKQHYWVFVGSRIFEGRFMGDVLGDLITTMHHPDTIVDNSLSEGTNEYIYNVNDKVCPKPGTKVTITIQAVSKPRS
ncbi:MAG: YdjY domain-containing protein [Verrucomicrobiae bacterium]|nr:YdjY domain-containing protein [Verrucomicrobiae bacterium]